MPYKLGDTVYAQMIFEESLQEINAGRHGDIIWPLYDSYCFSNIPSAVFYLLGVAPATPLSPILRLAGLTPTRNRKVVLILLDAFGYNHFMTYADRYVFLRRFTERGVVAPLTSVFPSTSSAALTTIHTGLTPQEHGLLEWRVYFREVGQIIQTLPFMPYDSHERDLLRARGHDPTMLLDADTFYQKLGKAGVPSYITSKEEFAETSYASRITRGAVKVRFKNASDFIPRLMDALVNAPSPAYFHVYWDSIDTVSHDHGPYSERYVNELDTIFAMFQTEFLEKLPANVAEETVFLLTADHGQVNVRPEDLLQLDQYNELTDYLRTAPDGQKIKPYGSSRDVFVAVEPGMVDPAVEFLKQTLGEKAAVIRTQDTFREGLFGRGTPHREFMSRLGDILIAPYGNGIMWYKYFPDWKFEDLGMHGGFSDDEMLVPFGVARAKDLV